MSRPCKEYRNAPNPTPDPVKLRLWALSDQRGRYWTYAIPKGVPILSGKKLEGMISGDGTVFKPRRVVVTVEAEDPKANG